MRRHPLVAYFVLAYALSWASWIPLALRGAVVVPGSGTPTQIPGLLGPALAAFLVPILAGDGVGLRSLLRRMRLVTRPAWRFWMVSLSPLLFLAVALLAGTRGTASSPALADLTLYSGLPGGSLGLVLLVVLLANGFGEETGWRGFALPRLQERFDPLGGTLALGLLWAGWHAPLFFIVETYRLMTPVTLVFGFGLGILAGAVVLSHVCHVTGGSVLAAALWHTTYNLTTATAAGRGIGAAVTTTCVMVWAVLVVVVELRRGRARSVLRVPEARASGDWG